MERPAFTARPAAGGTKVFARGNPFATAIAAEIRAVVAGREAIAAAGFFTRPAERGTAVAEIMLTTTAGRGLITPHTAGTILAAESVPLLEWHVR